MRKGTPITCHLQLAWQNKYAQVSKGTSFSYFLYQRQAIKRKLPQEDEGSSKAGFWTPSEEYSISKNYYFVLSFIQP